MFPAVPVNVPNVLTVIRILLVPVRVVALLEKTGYLARSVDQGTASSQARRVV
ncbi:MAG: hypothetical protein M3076_05930 [Actinomycetota bacterium]|nr:hypothetical protein [Actinomycetota bacterium]